MSFSDTLPLSKRRIEEELDSYEDLAGEYYDAARHPTCHALRSGSRLVIEKLFAAREPVRVAVELGAGRAILPECLPDGGKLFDRLFLVDSSPSMLAHSESFRAEGVRLMLENALSTTIESSTVDLVVASLGDPYNCPELWREIARILKPDGRAIFTTPALNWARRFRSIGQSTPEDTAEFLLADQSVRQVPSFIYDEGDQAELIRAAGLAAETTISCSPEEVPAARQAPKLGVIADAEPFVTGYLVRKPV